MKTSRRRMCTTAALILTVMFSLAFSACKREIVPDVIETPAGALSAEAIVATAYVEATRAAVALVESEPLASPAQTSPLPTPIPTTAVPTLTPTPVVPTPTPLVTPIPTLTPTPVSPPTPTPTPVPGGTVIHVVQPGENLFRIALRYGTTVQAIASRNGIANPALIYVGQRLVIPTSGGQQPTGTTYVVQPGDNLFRIALRFNMSYIYLAQYNGITNPSRIYVGQVLRIPPR